MRLPQPLLESPFFQFNTLAELKRALNGSIPASELDEVVRLTAAGLPPAASSLVLATIFGINPGLVWSFERKTARHYRTFDIPKGADVRRIQAPRVALKIIQKWFSVQLQKAFTPDVHVFGFVPNRSHVHAAACHLNARWVFSVDVENYFQSTPIWLVQRELISLGYRQESAEFLSRLMCLDGFLAQGAPSSPVLSNLCFRQLDARLTIIARELDVRMTRYADDIVFSGRGACPETLPQVISQLFEIGPWHLAERKTEMLTYPQRLKVHGLLVDGERIRLTKGYRKRLRAYRHLLANNRVEADDIRKFIGHVAYGKFVEQFENL